MPEFIDEKSGTRIYHENKTTLEVQKKILAKFSGKFDADGSYMHRKSPDAEVMDEARSKDMTGNPIIKAKAKLSLYDVEYKLDGMVVVPVDQGSCLIHHFCIRRFPMHIAAICIKFARKLCKDFFLHL